MGVGKGPVGPKGAYGATSEANLVSYLLSELETARGISGSRTENGDCYQPVDSFVILQTIDVLRRYQKLLAKPLGEVIAAVIGYLSGGAEGVNSSG